MRTITEMQKEIKKISSMLEELSKDIMEFEKNDNEKPSEDIFEKIKTYGKRNPIIYHPLATKDDIIKKHYMTLLISVIYTTNKNTLDAWLIAQRIASGISLSQELSEISLDALCLTEKQIDDFTYSIIENKLEEVFIFDLLLLYAVCGSSDNKMLEYIADLISLVNCSKKKLNELSALARIVVRQASNEYLDFCVADHEIDLFQFFCYIKPFHDGLLLCNKNSFYIWNNEEKAISHDIFAKLPDEITSRFVCIENTLFKDIEKNIKFFVFRGNEKIEIKNCKFENVANCLQIDEVSNLDIDKSEFNKMDNRALYITKTKKVSISDTKFTECEFITDERGGKAYGGALYLASIESLAISSSVFRRCICRSEEYEGKAYGGALYLATIDSLVISSSVFESCFARHEGGYATGAAVSMFMVKSGKLISNKFRKCLSQRWSYLDNSWHNDCEYLISYADSSNVKAQDCTYKDCDYIYYKEGFAEEQ